jgi:hypothetical protein
MHTFVSSSKIVITFALLLVGSAEALARCGTIPWCDNTKNPPVCKPIAVCMDVGQNGTTTFQIKDLDPEAASKILDQLHLDKSSIDALK